MISIGTDSTAGPAPGDGPHDRVVAEPVPVRFHGVSPADCDLPALEKVSGKPGRLPARAPHRSGRAEFPHPALQAHGFAARR